MPVARGPLLIEALRLGLLLLPLTLLLMSAYQHAGADYGLVWLAVGFQTVAAGWIVYNRERESYTSGPAIAALYLIGLLYLWLAGIPETPFTHFSRAVLLVVPLIVFGVQTLADSGALALRRARLLGARLAARRDWPADLAACRALSEVKALRAALLLDAGPALNLLAHPRPEVRIAALTALEFRKDYRPGEAEMVLHEAQRAEQPAIRAAAVAALANSDDRNLVESLAQFLYDTSAEVRKAAVDALLWDSDRRWNWLRHAVRRSLADPLFQSDGPLIALGQTLSPEAVKDLTGWCAEKGMLSARAALTLGTHYSRALGEHCDEAVVSALKVQLVDPHAPAMLRLELARVLQQHHELDPPVLNQLLAASNPAPLRLIAAEAILSQCADTPLRGPAVAALRGLARLPNR